MESQTKFAVLGTQCTVCVLRIRIDYSDNYILMALCDAGLFPGTLKVE